MTSLPDQHHFQIHDVTQFPIVSIRPEAIRPGYGPDWVREMEWFIAAPSPFVLLYADPLPEDDHEDFKLRGMWMKANRAKLAAQCKAMIRVEPDVAKHEAMLKHAAGTEKAFGVPTKVTTTVKDAMALAAMMNGNPA